MNRYNNSRSLTGNNVVDDLSSSPTLGVDMHQASSKQDRGTAHFIANTRTPGAT